VENIILLSCKRKNSLRINFALNKKLEFSFEKKNFKKLKKDSFIAAVEKVDLFSNITNKLLF
jgi:hypothetical protein